MWWFNSQVDKFNFNLQKFESIVFWVMDLIYPPSNHPGALDTLNKQQAQICIQSNQSG